MFLVNASSPKLLDVYNFKICRLKGTKIRLTCKQIGDPYLHAHFNSEFGTEGNNFSGRNYGVYQIQSK